MSGRTRFKPVLNHVCGFTWDADVSLAVLRVIFHLPFQLCCCQATTPACCQTATSLPPHNLSKPHVLDPAVEMLAPKELLVRIFEIVQYLDYHPWVCWCCKLWFLRGKKELSQLNTYNLEPCFTRKFLSSNSAASDKTGQSLPLPHCWITISSLIPRDSMEGRPHPKCKKIKIRQLLDFKLTKVLII